MSKYAIEADLKGTLWVDTSDLPAKSYFASFKVQVGQIDVDKLNSCPVDLSKLRNVVNNKVLKKYIWWIRSKSRCYDPIRFVLKRRYDTDKPDLEKKSMALTRKYLVLVVLLKIDYNAWIIEIEVKIPKIPGLGTSVAFNSVENKIPDVSNF